MSIVEIMKNILIYILIAISILNNKSAISNGNTTNGGYTDNNLLNGNISKGIEDSLSFAQLETSDIVHFNIKKESDTSILGNEYTTLEDFKHTIKEFIVITDVAFYDYNADGTKDAVFLIQGTDKSETMSLTDTIQIVNKSLRGLVLLMSYGDKYKVTMENDTCFYSEYEDGGIYFFPELELTMGDNGELIVVYRHGRYGYWNYKFKYDNNDFWLSNVHKEESTSWTTEILFKTDVDFGLCQIERWNLTNADELSIDEDRSTYTKPIYHYRKKYFAPKGNILLSKIDKVL